MEQTAVKRKWTSIRRPWSEALLILGLVLINLGFLLGKSETVDALSRFVVHCMDVRYWTWKGFGLLCAVLVLIVLISCRRTKNINQCRGIIVLALLVALMTVFHGVVEFSWNKTGKTFIVRKRKKGTPAVNEFLFLGYKVHVPRGYYSIGGRRPLIVFLHGAGDVKKNVEDIKEDIVNHIEGISKKDFPFVVISPASGKHGWNTRQILQILDETIVRWNIDPNRIYLTGFSMGGFGTFHVACDSPKTFAAIAPVAGGGEVERVERLKSVPTWAFHGDADDVVPYECSSKMIEAMKDAGCVEAKLTTLEGAGHGIIHDVYSRPELFRWLLTHRRRR